jgi:hypothetical protein
MNQFAFRKPFTLENLAEVINHRFDSVDQRFNTVDQRFNAIDQRLDSIDAKLTQIEVKTDDIIRITNKSFIAVARDFERLDTKIDGVKIEFGN